MYRKIKIQEHNDFLGDKLFSFMERNGQKAEGVKFEM